MVLLPISLVTGGLLALINLWLAARISLVRHPRKIDIGHGGVELLERRMRAHANFAEYVPIAVLLVALVEFTAGPSWPLASLAAVLVVARLLHPFGMDGWSPGRVVGTLGTWVPLAILAVWAIGLGMLTPMPSHAIKGTIPLAPATG